jgi:hypothetical protein
MLLLALESFCKSMGSAFQPNVLEQAAGAAKLTPADQKKKKGVRARAGGRP